MINITLKGGVVKEFEAGVSPMDIARGIGAGLFKAVCAAEINGVVCDLRTPIFEDAEVSLLTFEDKEGKKAFWHTTSHLLAQAVKRLFPDAQCAIGPAVDDGFYYDFDVKKPFSPEDLAKIEAEMKKIVKEGLALEKFEVSVDEARELVKGQPYKEELLEKHAAEGAAISFYRQGEFVDLCAGPHLPDVSRIKAFKLTSATGAYWHGDSSLPMLCRVYGVSFPKASELEEHLTRLEEARKRDPNKLGRELEYFTTVEEIGQGLPVLLPKGSRVIQTLQRWIEDEEQKRGYILTKTPLMAKRDLYRISGHWDHYLDGMFGLGDPMDEEKECFALRPMTCPVQYQVYLSKARSYRDLPMRLGETSTLFRNEDSGEMHGLIRVRQFTISEGHLILRPEQLEEEFKGCLELAKYVLDTVGMLENCTFRFSQWDPARAGIKYEGTPEQWEHAQTVMGQILDNLGLNYTIGIDEAAFYGPKLDIQYKNVFGKEDTIVTIQIDMLLAEKFGMEYVDSDGQLKKPYIIHRTSLGCYERTLAYLIERYAGALPTWMAPVQAKFLPMGVSEIEYCQKIADRMTAMGMRVEIDKSNNTVGYKIRAAQQEKVPYMLVVGGKEIEQNAVAVRSRKDGEKGVMPVDQFISEIMMEIAEKRR